LLLEKKHFSTILILLLLNTTLLIAQPDMQLVRFSLFKNGFNSSQIWDIQQDKKGFIWFSCDEGLFKFDGKNPESIVPIIKSTAEEGLDCKNFIFDENENVVLYRSSGYMQKKELLYINNVGKTLFIIDLKKYLPGLQEKCIGINYLEKSKYLIVCTSAVFVFDANQKSVSSSTIKDDFSTYFVFKDDFVLRSDKNLWVIDKRLNKKQKLPNQFDLRRITYNSTNKTIYGVNDIGELFTCKDDLKWNFKKTDSHTSIINKKPYPFVLSTDKHGGLYMGSVFQGLYYYNINNKSAYRINDSIPFSQFNELQILSLFFDKHEQLWVGTSNGLYIMYKNNTSSYDLPVFNNAINAFVGEFFIFKCNNYYFPYKDDGTYQYFNAFDTKIHNDIFFKSSFHPVSHLPLINSDYSNNTIYITNSETVENFEFNNKNNTLIPKKSYSVFNDKKNRTEFVCGYRIHDAHLLMGTIREGLWELKNNKIIKHYKDKNGFDIFSVISITQLNPFTYLIYSYKGIFKYDINKQEINRILAPESFKNNFKNSYIVRKTDTSFYFSSKNAIHVYDKMGNKITTYTIKPELGNIIGLAANKNNTLFALTPKHVLQLSFLEKNAVTAKKIAEATPKKQFNYTHFSNFTADNELLIAGTNNMLSIIKFNDYKPSKNEDFDKKNISINIENVYSTEKNRKKIISFQDNKISLNYNQNNIHLNINTTNVSWDKNIFIEYNIFSEDTLFYPVFSTSNFPLPTLALRKNLLTLRAKDDNGKVLAQSVYEIYVNPPFWFTWWFITLVFLSAFLLFLILYYYRLQHVKRTFQKQEESLLQKQMLADLKNNLFESKLKVLQAQMNPHLISNLLQSLKNSADNNTPNEQIQTAIENAGKLFRETLNISDQGYISIDKEIEYINLYTKVMKTNIRKNIDLTINISPNNAPLQDYYIPGMIIQPIVENSILHGYDSIDGKKKIDVQIEIFEKFMLCKVHNLVNINNSFTQPNNHKSLSTKIIQERLDTYSKLYKENFFYSFNTENLSATTILKIPIFKSIQ
jgi:hypothetical protein